MFAAAEAYDISLIPFVREPITFFVFGLSDKDFWALDGCVFTTDKVVALLESPFDPIKTLSSPEKSVEIFVIGLLVVSRTEPGFADVLIRLKNHQKLSSPESSVTKGTAFGILVLVFSSLPGDFDGCTFSSIDFSLLLSLGRATSFSFIFSVSGSNGTWVFFRSLLSESLPFEGNFVATLFSLFISFPMSFSLVAFGNTCVELFSSRNIGDEVVDSFEFSSIKLFITSTGNSTPGSVGSSVSTFGSFESLSFDKVDSLVKIIFEVDGRTSVANFTSVSGVTICASVTTGATESLLDDGLVVATFTIVAIGADVMAREVVSMGSLEVNFSVGATVDIFIQTNVPISFTHVSSRLQLSVFCEHSSISRNQSYCI